MLQRALACEGRLHQTRWSGVPPFSSKRYAWVTSIYAAVPGASSPALARRLVKRRPYRQAQKLVSTSTMSLTRSWAAIMTRGCAFR